MSNLILVGYDFSDRAPVALDAALDLASRSNARLHIAHVVNATGSSLPPIYTQAQIEEVHRRALAMANGKLEQLTLPDRDGLEITRAAYLGIPGKVLAEVAQTMGANLVIISSHGYGAVRRFFLGSVGSALIRASKVPVLIVGEARADMRNIERVVAAVDLSEISSKVLEKAVEMTPKGARLYAMAVHERPLWSYGGEGVPPMPAVPEETLEETLNSYRRSIKGLLEPLDTEGRSVDVNAICETMPSGGILREAKRLEADLVVVGTSGHGFWHRMIVGSTATKVISEAPCPVLVVPHEQA